MNILKTKTYAMRVLKKLRKTKYLDYENLCNLLCKAQHKYHLELVSIMLLQIPCNHIDLSLFPETDLTLKTLRGQLTPPKDFPRLCFLCRGLSLTLFLLLILS